MQLSENNRKKLGKINARIVLVVVVVVYYSARWCWCGAGAGAGAGGWCGSLRLLQIFVEGQSLALCPIPRQLKHQTIGDKRTK